MDPLPSDRAPSATSRLARRLAHPIAPLLALVRSDLAWIVVGTLGIQLIALVTGTLTARMLGVEGRGQLALVLTIAFFVTNLTLAGGPSVAVAQALAQDRLRARESLRRVTRTLLLIGVLVSVGAGGYVWLALPASTSTRWALTVATVALTLLLAASSLITSAIRGELHGIRRLTASALALPLPYVILVTGAYVLDLRPNAAEVVGLQVVGGIAGLAYCWRLLLPDTGRRAPIDRAELWAVSRANHVNAVGSLNRLGLDRQLIGIVMGTHSLGVYAAATTVATFGAMVGNAVAVVLQPRLAALRHDAAARRHLLARWVPASALVFAALVGLLQVVVGPVIHFAFGEPFAAAVEPARWLLVADGFLGFRRVLNAVLQSAGRGRTASVIELGLTVVLLVAVAAAAYAGNLVLAAAAMAATSGMSCLTLGAVIARDLRRTRRNA